MRGSRSKLWSALACASAMWGVVGVAGYAVASPGTVFSAATAGAPLGQWLLLLGVLALPLLLYVRVREHFGIIATRRDLQRLARVRPEFRWQDLAAEASRAIAAIYAGWHAGKLEAAAQYLDPELYAAQCALLQRWQAEGKRNVSQLGRVRRLQPLWVRTKDADQPDRVALLVRLDQLDYLEEVATGRVVQGSRRALEGVEVVWLLAFIDRSWRVTGIEGVNQAFTFATLPNEARFSRPAPDPERARVRVANP